MRVLKNLTMGLASMLAVLTVNAAQAADLEIGGSFDNWSYAKTPGVQECFIVSKPVRWSAQRDGQTVSVNRGDIRFYITIIPGEPNIIEPSFGAGYPLKQSVMVQMQIGDTSFTLRPNADVHAEYAWPRPEEDATLVSAMRGGSEAVVTGTSTRGTVTTDTFSLIGFTAAYAKAQELCQ